MNDKIELTPEQKKQIEEVKKSKDLFGNLKEFGVSPMEVVNNHGRGIRTTNDNTAIIADYSFSMEGDYLNMKEAPYEIVARTLNDYQGFRTFYMYNSAITEEKPLTPRGGTPLAQALKAVIDAGIKNVVVITDGQPDSESACKPYAQQLCINTIFIGSDSDTRAINFLRQLCEWSNGTFSTMNLNTELLSDGLNRLLIPQDTTKSNNEGDTIQL